MCSGSSTRSSTAGSTVMQVVPSYLEVVLSYLERDRRPLPDLRCVSVTGEAVKKELDAALVRAPSRGSSW